MYYIKSREYTNTIMEDSCSDLLVNVQEPSQKTKGSLIQNSSPASEVLELIRDIGFDNENKLTEKELMKVYQTDFAYLVEYLTKKKTILKQLKKMADNVLSFDYDSPKYVLIVGLAYCSMRDGEVNFRSKRVWDLLLPSTYFRTVFNELEDSVMLSLMVSYLVKEKMENLNYQYADLVYPKARKNQFYLLFDRFLIDATNNRGM